MFYGKPREEDPKDDNKISQKYLMEHWRKLLLTEITSGCKEQHNHTEVFSEHI